MRITFLQLSILFIALGSAMGREGRAQAILKTKASINESNVTLNQVFTELEKAYHINFVYSTQLVDVNQRVNVFVQLRPLSEVLDQALKPLALTYEAAGDVILIRNLQKEHKTTEPAVPLATQQAIAITGKVVDDKTGEPLPGVTVKVKGTTVGITTNANGIYSLSVPDRSAVVVFSFIGYEEQEKVVGDQTIVNVVLKEKENKLNEVVVIGYATEKKSQVTGAIGSIKASDIENQQITRFDDALRGQVAGVNVIQSSGAPGSTPTVKIRGTTSINSSNPLYVIDGVVIDNGGLDNINPADIESIDVLKDASAAIYGSRASAGVVIVTTKKGKGAPQLNYSGYYGIQNPIKRLNMANATQYAQLRNQSLANDGKAAAFANPDSYGAGTNWQDVLFGKNVPVQNHNLNVGGSNDKATYYTSFGYLSDDGIAVPSIANYKRGNFSVNTTYKVASWLTIGENLALSTTKSQLALSTNYIGSNYPLASAILLDPITPVVVTDINSQPNATVYKNNAQYLVYDKNGNPYGISPYVQNEAANIAAYVKVNQGGYSWATNILGNTFLEIAPVKGLKLRSQISVKAAYYGSNSFTPIYYYSPGTNNITQTTQSISSSRNITLNWDNTASYNRSFGLHNANLLVGTSMQSENGHGLSGSFIGEPVNTFDEASPNYSLANASKIANGSDAQPYKLASIFGRASYNYAEKYLVDFTIRRDGSSKFGPSNRYAVFPSAGVAYILSKESFFPKTTFVNFLKLRASYGVLGNEQALGLFQYTSIVGSGSNYLFGNSDVNIGYRPNGLSNPDLKWEQIKMSNIGLDFVMFGALNGAVEAYKKITNGMLQQISIPNYIGTSSNPYANIGNLQNKGMEFSLNYAGKAGTFSYTAGGNISYNENQVTYLGTTAYYGAGNLRGTSYEIERTTVGQPYQAFFGFVEQGTFKSQAEINAYTNAAGGLIQPNAKPGDFKWTDINGDGKIDANDRTYQGNSVAPWNYGLNVSAAYHHFDIRAFGQGVWGNKVFQDYTRPDYPTANYQLQSLNAWSPSNPDSNFPRLSDADPNNNFKNPSNFFLQSGAYFRLKTLQLGYSLPEPLMRAAHMKKVRLYASGNNLFTITKYTGFDPEIAGGSDFGIYPQARTYMVGLDISL